MKPIFTRYLYYKKDVELSLLGCILKKDIEKAIFWAYELYFSGFEKELFKLLSLLYKKYYAPINTKKLGFFLEEKKKEWANNHYKHFIIATIVHTIAQRPSLSDGQIMPPKILFFVYYKNADVEKYKTIKVSPDIRSYRILQKACIYSTEKNMDSNSFDLEEFEESDSEESESRETLLEKYFYHWEFYSFLTPVWKERIEKYGGQPNDETRKIIFTEEELEDAFYKEYGYEPDEQPAEITKRTIG